MQVVYSNLTELTVRYNDDHSRYERSTRPVPDSIFANPTTQKLDAVAATLLNWQGRIDASWVSVLCRLMPLCLRSGTTAILICLLPQPRRSVACQLVDLCHRVPVPQGLRSRHKCSVREPQDHVVDRIFKVVLILIT